MAALNREEILAAIERRSKELVAVEVPEWDGTVYVRRLSAHDVQRTGMMDTQRTPQVLAGVLAASLTDEDGGELFAAEDLEAIGKIDMTTMVRVFTECLRINGLLDEQTEKDVQDFVDGQSATNSTD